MIRLFAVLLTASTGLYAGTWQRIQVPAGSRSIAAHVYLPSAETQGMPLLIALHGWNRKGTEWKTSGISEMADVHGIVVACPEMGAANYERRYFPQTTLKWADVPSGPWLREVLLPAIEQRFRTSTDRRKRGLIGVSTGGHGALLEAGYYPETFGFAAMISGDFDVSLTPEDGLALGSFGPHNRFKQRWREESAVSFMTAYESTRVYLAHGAKDPVAPVSQSRLAAATFSQKAGQSKGRYEFIYSESPSGGHDWDYWRIEVRKAVEFFAAGLHAK